MFFIFALEVDKKKGYPISRPATSVYIYTSEEKVYLVRGLVTEE